MSFHYSSSSHSGTAMDMSQPTYMSSYPPSTNSIMEGMNEPDTDPLGLSGEKKRNRLGYARTNMACGNCRKRKIRCQPVKDDGRCSQCIRLKKDCQFYAVDQQPPPAVVRAGSKSLSNTMLASAASPPPIAPSHPGNIQTHQPYHGKAIPMSHDMRPPGMRPDTYLDDPKLTPAASAARPYNYGQSIDNWASTAASPTVKPGSMNASWRSYPSESPVAPGYAPCPAPVSQAPATWTTAPLEATEGASRTEDAWSPYQQPTRSMSFSGEHSVQYATTPSRTYDRKASIASEIYHPTSIDTVPSTSYTVWQQPYQPWYAEGGQPVSSAGENAAQIDGMYYGR